MSVVFNLRDIERIDVVYEDDSETWKWLNMDNKLNVSLIKMIKRKVCKKNIKETEK